MEDTEKRINNNELGLSKLEINVITTSILDLKNNIKDQAVTQEYNPQKIHDLNLAITNLTLKLNQKDDENRRLRRLMRLNVTVPNDQTLKQSLKKENQDYKIDEIGSQFGVYEEDYRNFEEVQSPTKKPGSFMQLFTRKHSLRRMDSNISQFSPNKQRTSNKVHPKGFDFDDMVLDSNDDQKDEQYN